MIESIIKKEESKVLEFKENCRPLQQIIKTIVAFANTSGGVIVIGVTDSKDVIGIQNALDDEEKVANSINDSIRPIIVPDIQIHLWRNRELLVITVPHIIGPFYVKAEGPENGVYLRLGSTNRRAGPEIIAEIRRLSVNMSFDEQPYSKINSEAIDFRAASELFGEVSKQLTATKKRSLGLHVVQGQRVMPSQGAVLLFAKNRTQYFPDAMVRCARFAGNTTERFIDQLEITDYLPITVEKIISFIEKHTCYGYKIDRLKRKDIYEYPPVIIREAVINAVVHADYSLGGNCIKVAIFDNRIEITNPGILPFGLTLEAALSGVSQLRNRVIGRVFRELELIEQWGSGIGRILSVCAAHGLKTPGFEEIGTNFRVTLYKEKIKIDHSNRWSKQLLEQLSKNGEITTREAAQLWETTDRTARTRLRKMVNDGLLIEIGTNPRDPKRKYIRKE